mgnify:CR=1 FL=1
MFLNFFTYKIYHGQLKDLNLNLNFKTVINTINPHSYIVSKKDKTFSNALLSSDYLLPDGIGIVLAIKILFNIKTARLTGAKIHDFLLKKAEIESLSVFYLGSSNKTLKLIKSKNTFRFAGLKASYFSPPFKPAFSENDNKNILKKINSFKPDILFVGMTAPKQEKWTFLNKDKIDSNIIVSIGAVFDFYAGTVIRPSPFVQKIGFEWAVRFAKEPIKLFKRNFVSTPLFLFDLFLEKIKQLIP